jgi:hypothetical protein
VGRAQPGPRGPPHLIAPARKHAHLTQRESIAPRHAGDPADAEALHDAVGLPSDAASAREQALTALPEAAPPAAMEPLVAQGFSELRATLRSHLSADGLAAAAALRAALPDWQRPARFGQLGAPFSAAAARAEQGLPGEVLADVSRLLIAELALSLEQTLSRRNLVPEVMALVAPAASRLLNHLRTAADASYRYPDDYFVKDLRFVAGMTVPGGAEVLDLRSKAGTRVSAQVLRRQPTLAHLRALLTGSRTDPWFRIHTEKRYLRHFHEAGWDAFYRRVAAMLQAHPCVRGVVGTSWFFDPQLDAISPRLSYLRKPLERGAFLVPGRTSAFDIASATVNSDVRRQLFEQGRYMPVPQTLVWPRGELLRWARSLDDPASAG